MKPTQATDQPYPPGAETKSKRNYDPIAWGKETQNRQNEKTEKYYADEEQKLTRQIYKEKIGKLPEKEFRVMIVKIQNLNNTREKI